MASSLISNYNSDYFLSLSRLVNRPDRIKVLVEDEFDVPFWNDLLNNNDSGLYFEISPYCVHINETTKGKSNILKLHKNLGPHLIACIDSDYDYLIQTSSDAKVILDTRYILQTYVYSVENYLCHASTLNAICTSAVSVQSEFDFERLLEDYSKIIYPVLIWSLLLEKKGYNVSRREITKSMISERDPDFSLMMQNIKTKADKKVKQFETVYPACISEIPALTEDMTKKGLIPENTYLFVVGHTLENFIIKSIIEPIRVLLHTQHIKTIKSMSTSEEDKRNKINHFKNKQIDVQSLISCNFNYKSRCIIYSTLLKPSIDKLILDLQSQYK